MVSRATASSSGRPLAAERVANSRLRFSSDVVMCDHSLDKCDHTTRASQRRSSRGIRQGALAYAALHALPKPARGAPNTELAESLNHEESAHSVTLNFGRFSVLHSPLSLSL